MAGGEKAKSDLGVRAASAVVMVAVAGTALWLGGWIWALFAVAIGGGVMFEWIQLVSGFEARPLPRLAWFVSGAGYIGLAVLILVKLRLGHAGLTATLVLIAAVIAVDVGAYFAGRTFGGPKIAPAISPSKTWSGLFGGVLGATVLLFLANAATCDAFDAPPPTFSQCLNERPLANFGFALVLGVLAAIIAQTGDFFESWMKRRAGVKDSGKLIPGHGGLFDRVDGLLAVLFVIGLLSLHSLFISE